MARWRGWRQRVYLLSRCLHRGTARIDTAQLFRVPVPTVVGVWRDGSARLAVMLYQLLTRRETPTAEQLQQMMVTGRTGATDEQFSSVAACMAVVATPWVSQSASITSRLMSGQTIQYSCSPARVLFISMFWVEMSINTAETAAFYLLNFFFSFCLSISFFFPVSVFLFTCSVSYFFGLFINAWSVFFI